MRPWRTFACALLLFIAGNAMALTICTFPRENLINTNKLALIREYALRHYGLDTFELRNPEMIVIHFTETATLKEAVEYFLPDALIDRKEYIGRFGSLNVGIHYFVDKNGDALAFYPENLIARHIIGYNYTAIGIENIAEDRFHLTRDQMETDAALVAQIKSRHPSVRYLIGHDEYDRTNLAHYALYRAEDTNYRMLSKPDPGKVFMKGLRDILKKKYGLVFGD